MVTATKRSAAYPFPFDRGIEVNTNSTGKEKRPGNSGDTKGSRKKPYVKPAVRHERVFETSALTCGKVGGISRDCILVPRNS